MDHPKRLRELTTFLQPYQRIWQNEIMLQYPHALADYPADWVEELASFQNPIDVIKLEKKEVQGLISNPELLNFYSRIEELCVVEPIPEYPPMPENHYTFLYMIPKKQYEIRRLAPLVNAHYHDLGVEQIVDIGGGIGLLAQTLNNEFGLKITTVDMDPILQSTGSKRHEKNARNPSNKVQYQNVKVSAEEGNFTRLLTPGTLTLGLHTCGDLANDQIRASRRAGVKGIINFGCCYHKLTREDSQNISQSAQGLEQKVVLNKFALTLASRAHCKMDEKDFALKQKVKLYRYAMHMLLHDEYATPGMVTLGNSHPKLYDESFGTYALEQLPRIGIHARQTKEELDAFFADKNRQDLIRKMIAAGLIRNALGRPLEVYLQLDRVMYLRENGYEAEVMSFFDESTSPRNLGIIARRTSL